MRWEVEPLENCAEINFGTRVTRKKDAGTRYPVYGGGGATFLKDEFNREDELVVARFAMSEKCTRFVEGKFFLNDSGLTLKTKNESKLRQQFLEWQCIAKNRVIYDLGRGTAQKNLNTKDFKRLSFVIPPLDEQERLVEVLDEAFAAIDKAKANIERNLTNARELFQSRLNDIFSNPSEDWEVKPLGEMTRTGAGGTPLKSNSTFYEPPEVPWLLSGEVGQREIHRVKNQISTLGLENSSAKLFPINSVLVAMYGATAGEVGVLKVETATNQAVCAIYPCEKIGHDFIYFFMLFFKDALVAQAVGGAQPNVSQAKIKAIRIPVPPLTEQDRIVNELKALSKMRENLETKYQTELDNLEELRQSILEQAFEGKLTEPVAA